MKNPAFTLSKRNQGLPFRSILFSLICFSLIPLKGFSLHPDPVRKDSLFRGVHFEVSFGQSLLFISGTRQATLRANSAVIVPTNAVLMFTEFRHTKTMRVPVFINLATESKQYLVNGQIVNERASPTIGSGLTFRFAQYKVDERSNLEAEAGPLVSILFDRNKHIRLAPVMAGRVRVSRNESFSMYLGMSYSVGVNAFGLLYGTGTFF